MSGDSDVEIKIGASTDGLDAGTDKVKSNFQEMGEEAEGLKDNLEGLAATFAEVFAVEKLEEFADRISDIGEQIDRMTHMTGMSSDQVQNFQNVITALGGDAQTAGMSLIRMERNVSDAAAGIGDSAQAFQRLGVSMDALKRGDINEILGQMADKMVSTADGANKTGAMLEAAGRGAASLLPALDMGREGFEQLEQAINQTGVRLSPELVERFSESALGMKVLRDANQAVAESFYAQLEPALDAAVAGFTLFETNTANATRNGQGLSEGMKLLGGIIDGVTVAVTGLATAFEGLLEAVEAFAAVAYDVMKGSIDAIVDAWHGGVTAIQEVFQGNFSTAFDTLTVAGVKSSTDFSAGWTQAFDDFKAKFSDAANADMGGKFTDQVSKMMKVFNGEDSVSPVKLGDSKGKGKIGGPTGKGDEDQDNGANLAQQRQGYQEDYELKKEFDDLKVASGQMTRSQEFADLQQGLSEQQALTDASFESEMYDYELTDEAFNRLQDQKINADKRFALEHGKLTLQQADEDEKYWTKAIETADKSLDTMLQGVLQGTQTMGQAFARMASNMVLSFVEAVAKILVENALLVATQNFGWTQMAGALQKSLGQYVLVEQQKTAAVIGGNAARTASDTASATTSSLATKGAASGTIMQDAYESAANVYANVSAIPYVGWILAPAAAAAAFGVVAAYDSFDVGTPYVPNDMLAQIHKGEAIVPAKTAQSWRDGDLGIGGGDSAETHTHVHFNISSMDASGVAAMMKKHSSAISGAVVSAARGGNGGLRNAFSKM
jgi:hypothetical protein